MVNESPWVISKSIKPTLPYCRFTNIRFSNATTPGTIVMSERNLGSLTSENKCINAPVVVSDGSWEGSPIHRVIHNNFYKLKNGECILL